MPGSTAYRRPTSWTPWWSRSKLGRSRWPEGWSSGPPCERSYWFFRNCVLDDVYKPHTFKEVQELVSSEVAARLDPHRQLRNMVVQPQAQTAHTSLEEWPEWKVLPLAIRHCNQASRRVDSCACARPRHTARVGRRRKGSYQGQSSSLIQWATVLGTLGTDSLLWCVRTPHGNCSRAWRRRTLENVLLLSLPHPEQRGGQRLPTGKELPSGSAGGTGMGGDLPYLRRPGKAPR